MGLFSFLKPQTNQEVAKSENGQSFEFKDLTNEMFFRNPKPVSEESLGEGFQKLVHTVTLEKPLYGLFNTATVTCAKQNNELVLFDDGSPRLALVSFSSKSRDIQKIKKITTDLLELFEKTDDDWIEADEMRIKQGIWRGRRDFELKFDIALHADEDLKLDFLGFNSFLNKFN